MARQGALLVGIVISLWLTGCSTSGGGGEAEEGSGATNATAQSDAGGEVEDNDELAAESDGTDIVDVANDELSEEAPAVFEAPQKAVKAGLSRVEPVVEKAQIAPAAGAMKIIRRNCPLYAKPQSSAARVGDVKKGKRLWVDPGPKGWGQVSMKRGPAYLKKECY